MTSIENIDYLTQNTDTDLQEKFFSINSITIGEGSEYKVPFLNISTSYNIEKYAMWMIYLYLARKKNLSSTLKEKFRMEKLNKQEVINGYEDQYNNVFNSVIPQVTNYNAHSIDLKITSSNTFYLNVNFNNEDILKLEAYIRDRELGMEEPISIIYKLISDNKRYVSRIAYLSNIKDYLSQDLLELHYNNYIDNQEEEDKEENAPITV